MAAGPSFANPLAVDGARPQSACATRAGFFLPWPDLDTAHVRADQFSRAPLATDGCLALANPDLERILRTVEPRSTPVVIAKQLQWVAPHSVQSERKSFDAVLNAWRNAKSEGDMKRLLGFYAPDFQSYRKKPLEEWSQVLQAETRALKGRELQLKDKSYLRWTDSTDTMVVTFG